MKASEYFDVKMPAPAAGIFVRARKDSAVSCQVSSEFKIFEWVLAITIE